MATIRVTTSPSGQSVYAVEGDPPNERRLLLGYIGTGNVFFAARDDAATWHRQRWGAALQNTIETHWRGKPLP